MQPVQKSRSSVSCGPADDIGRACSLHIVILTLYVLYVQSTLLEYVHTTVCIYAKKNKKDHKHFFSSLPPKSKRERERKSQDKIR